MAKNLITKTEYDLIKNETYAVISFKDGRRVMTFKGASLTNAMKEVMLRGSQGCVTLVLNEKDLPKDSWGFPRLPSANDIRLYDNYFKLQSTLF